jgi:hypothetical protein
LLLLKLINGVDHIRMCNFNAAESRDAASCITTAEGFAARANFSAAILIRIAADPSKDRSATVYKLRRLRVQSKEFLIKKYSDLLSCISAGGLLKIYHF